MTTQKGLPYRLGFSLITLEDGPGAPMSRLLLTLAVLAMPPSVSRFAEGAQKKACCPGQRRSLGNEDLSTHLGAGPQFELNEPRIRVAHQPKRIDDRDTSPNSSQAAGDG